MECICSSDVGTGPWCGGRGSDINLRGWCYMFIYLMDKQQSPSQNWMPTSSGEAGCRLGMSVGGGGGADMSKIQNKTQNLPLSTDSDDG